MTTKSGGEAAPVGSADAASIQHWARSADAVRADDRAHVFHSWSAQELIDPLPIARALRLVLLGLRRQALPRSQLAARQREHRPSAPAPRRRDPGAGGQALHGLAGVRGRRARRGRAAHRRARAPGDLDVVFFTNGGAEANENAVRMARLHTGRHKVMAAYRSYHGATAGSIALTGEPRRWPSEPGMPGVVRYWGPYLYRSSFHADDRGRGVRARARASARGARWSKARTPSPRSCSRPSSARTAFSCRPTATSPASARSATSSASS